MHCKDDIGKFVKSHGDTITSYAWYFKRNFKKCHLTPLDRFSVKLVPIKRKILRIFLFKYLKFANVFKLFVINYLLPFFHNKIKCKNEMLLKKSEERKSLSSEHSVLIENISLFICTMIKLRKYICLYNAKFEINCTH